MGKFLVAVHQLSETDGRLRRSERTRQALIEAYLDLLGEKQQPPTTPEIAKRAGCSTRLVYERFSDLRTLSVAAADHAFAQVSAQASVPIVDADLHTRLTSQVGSRAAICERWLPLWRALLRYQGRSEELAIRVKRTRAAMVRGWSSRTGRNFQRCLNRSVASCFCLGHSDRFRKLGRLRESHGLSIEAARDIWINAIGRMLPTVGLDPARSTPSAAV